MGMRARRRSAWAAHMAAHMAAQELYLVQGLEGRVEGLGGKRGRQGRLFGGDRLGQQERQQGPGGSNGESCARCGCPWAAVCMKLPAVQGLADGS